MPEKKVVELRILENDFSVKLESEDYIHEIATFVNDELTKVKERNPFHKPHPHCNSWLYEHTEKGLLFEAKRI